MATATSLIDEDNVISGGISILQQVVTCKLGIAVLVTHRIQLGAGWICIIVYDSKCLTVRLYYCNSNNAWRPLWLK